MNGSNRLSNFSTEAHLLREMTRIRMVEEAIAARYAEQEMRCPVHLSIGQEAIAVGVSDVLETTDRVLSTHRCHAHYLAKGGDLKAMLAEIYGKAEGCIGGRGGSMHLADDSVSFHLSIPIIGSSVPLAVGAAMGDKFRGSDRVSVAFFGDATVEEGVFHECANFASLHKLPVIFVCENNFFSIYSPIEQRQPARPIAKLGEAHGIPSVSADGNDVLAVRAIAADAVRRARAGQGPSFLVFDTFRWHEHCGPSVDDHLGYRANHDVEAWRARCPIQKLERDLGGCGIMSAADIAQVRKNLDLEIEDAFAFARNAPLPAPSLANLYVYA